MSARPLLILAALGTLAAALWPRRASASLLPSLSDPASFFPGLSAVGDLRSFIAGHEGRMPYVYKDSAGRETFGVGHLLTAGDGYLRQYTRAKPAPDALVNSIFDRDSAAAVAAVSRLHPPRALKQSERVALTSLAFNIGASAFAGSTVAKQVNAGNFQAAADAFRLWNKAKNARTGALEVASGLASRRDDERDLFLA